MNSQPVEIPKKWGLRGAFSLSRLVPALAVIGFSWFCLYYRGVGHVPLFGHNATESVVPLSGGTRERPIAIAPHGDLRAEVSDDHLRVVLSAAVPYWDPIRTPAALHAVRLWGVDFEFPVGRQGTRIPRGRDYLAVLLDEHAFRCENRDAIGDTVDTADSFLFATRFGIGVSVNNEPTEKHLLGAAHVDQLLKVLADADIARSTPVVTESASGSIADLLADSIARFSLEQELEFTALAYCRWLPPQTEWRNRFNARFSFDDVARKLCGQPLGTGACNGIHGLQAIAQMLAVDKLHPLLSDSSISQIEGHLRECTLCLEANELPSGGWGDAWSGVAGPLPDGEQVWSPRFTVISSTGHHLEWIAIAPAELRPATPIVRRAIQALVREVAGMSESDRSNFKHFLPVSHAARALCQLRGESAIRLWQGLAPTTTNGGAK